MLLDNSNPATLFPGTTWQKQEGRFLQGTSGSEGAGGTGGASSVTLSTNHLPGHNHPITISITNGGNHRHQVDNHTHTQPVHSHSLDVGRSNTSGAPNAQKCTNGNDVQFNMVWSTRAAGGENTGGSAPYTNYNGDHNHGASASCGSAGGGASFSILPPYLRVNMWKRLT